MNPCVPSTRSRGLRRALRLAAAACVVAPLMADPASDPKYVVLSVELPNRPTSGARLFAQKSCVRCHSLGGRETRIGPDLGRLLFSGTVLDLAGAFWNHAPVMREKMQDLKVTPPRMTSGEMADIVALLSAYRYYLTELGEPGDPAAGRKVFAAKECAGCHADDERVWGKPGPSLQRYRGRFSGIFLAQAMWNHGPEMAAVMRGRGVAWPRFDGRDMGNLLAYLQTGNGGASGERLYLEPGSPRRGRDVFVAKRCVTCHAIAGSGGRGGPDLGVRGRELVRPVAEIAGLMWNHSLGMVAEFQRRGIERITFSGQEMADVIAYLYFVNYATVRAAPARGAMLYQSKCGACHTVGGGAQVGPDLATVADLDDPFGIIAAMWNHAPKMDQELRKRGLPWPRFEPGDAADLTAFLLGKRAAPRGIVARTPRK